MDPELISPSVCSALLLEIEAAQVQQTPEACMRHVVSHALQAALGEACHTGALQRKLQVIALPLPVLVPAQGPARPHQLLTLFIFLPLLLPYHPPPPKSKIKTLSISNTGKNADKSQKKIKITHTPLPRHISN